MATICAVVHVVVMRIDFFILLCFAPIFVPTLHKKMEDLKGREITKLILAYPPFVDADAFIKAFGSIWRTAMDVEKSDFENVHFAVEIEKPIMAYVSAVFPVSESGNDKYQTHHQYFKCLKNQLQDNPNWRVDYVRQVENTIASAMKQNPKTKHILTILHGAFPRNDLKALEAQGWKVILLERGREKRRNAFCDFFNYPIKQEEDEKMYLDYTFAFNDGTGEVVDYNKEDFGEETSQFGKVINLDEVNIAKEAMRLHVDIL